MDPFELPAELPTDVDGLTALRDAAQAYLAYLIEQHESGAATFDPQVSDAVLADIETINSALAEANADDSDHEAARDAALERARAAAASAETEADDVVEGEVEETESREPAMAAAGGSTSAPTKRKVVSFRGTGPSDLDETDPEPTDSGPAWLVSHGAPGFDDRRYGSKVGFKEMGEALDSCTKGRGVGRLSGVASGPKFRQSVAKMSRGLEVVESDRQLVDAINAATTEIPGHGKVTTESLVAAGGWCAPSEQIYTFCDIPEASDLISLPEIAIRRGGLRWPVEPDLTSLFESFEFFFTEPELEAVDGNGDPTAIKHCVEIPCPDEFEELRLNAVGYCVEAGILQRQGWPESIEYVLRALTQEHLRAMSRRTILDMWNGGGAPKVFNAALQVGGTSSVLNSLDLMATNLRLQKGYSKTYPIEIVAPSWFHAALRADMAMMEGIDTKYVTDGQIQQWLSARNIAGQFVGDWQTRDVTLPGHLDTLRWPGHVDVMMYPAGTWFRHLSNIIEVGVLYPKEQLQINRYTEFFTEDAIAVGKRCDRSVNLRIPLLINGGYGAPVTITHTDTTPDSGAGGVVGAEPVEGGQVDTPVTRTLTAGTATGGTVKFSQNGYEGSATLALGAGLTAANIKTALDSIDAAYDFTVTGTGPWTIEGPSGTLAITSSAPTGGTAPALS